jgi:hypothetical protein
VAAERNHPLLAALAHDPQHSAAHVDVLPVEADEFPHAQSSGVEQFEDRSITGIERAGSRCGVEEVLDLAWPQMARECLWLFWSADGHCRILLERSLTAGEAQQ